MPSVSLIALVVLPPMMLDLLPTAESTVYP